MKEKDERFNKRMLDGISQLSSRLDTDDIIDPIDAAETLESLKQLRGDAKSRSKKITYAIGLVNHELKDNLQSFTSKYDSFRDEYNEHNQKLLPPKAEKVGILINPVEGRNLDSQQLSSIAFDIKSRLIIAGAGTGKTTTIIGLVKYLFKAGFH